MRDDLHVGTSLCRPWQRLLKVLPREADHATRGPVLAASALQQDFEREVRPALIGQIVRAAAVPQRTFDGVPDALDRLSPRTELERDLLRHTKRAVRAGAPPGEALSAGIAGTLTGMAAARYREIDAVTASKHRHGGELSECRRKLTHSLSPATVRSATNAILAGERVSTRPATLDLDMDLR